MDNIKIESFKALNGEFGREPKDKPVWVYKALDTKTQQVLVVVVDTDKKPSKFGEEMIHKHILAAFKRAEKETNDQNKME